MLARRLLAFAALLFALAAVAAALVPQGNRTGTTGTTTTPTTTQATTPSGPSGRSGATGRTVQASLPRTVAGDGVVHAVVGDLIELDVTSQGPDTAEVVGLGQIGAVDADTPARFSFIPSRAGTFEVRLQGANRVVGRLRIAPRH